MHDDLLDRIAQRTEKKQAEIAAPQPCFKLGKGKSQFPRSIQIVQDEGKAIKSIAYAYIQDTHYEQNVAIILFFVTATVTIYGKHLDELYKQLNEHKVSQIMPATKPVPMDMFDEDTALITKIDVTYNDPQREKNIEAVQQNAFGEKGNLTR